MYYILADVWISEVAEHSPVCCFGVKSLELTDLHLCDGQACWGRCQLHTNNEIIPVSILRRIFFILNSHLKAPFSFALKH